MDKQINVAIIGTRFMGRAHSTAWSRVSKHFDLALAPVLKVSCGRSKDAHHQAFAEQFGWETISDDWERVVNDPDIQIVDICTSNKS
ncbi:MAG: Gfo/Idh/MocA family oxidoreductase, partial [Anaerolineales bacterium]